LYRKDIDGQRYLESRFHRSMSPPIGERASARPPEAFIFTDYEYDVGKGFFGIDVMQVAVGPHVFAFDELLTMRAVCSLSRV
jgi:hypothetical protein